MNIALGAVLIFILLLPPIAFYISYTFGPHSRGGLRFSFLDGLLASAIFSLLIHGLAIGIVRLIGLEVRFDMLLKLVGGEIKDLELKISNKEWMRAVREFLCYNASIFVVMVGAGQLLRALTIRFNWDRRELFRINNNWWYFFNGFERNDIVVYDNPFVDVVVDTNSGTIIYSGYLVRYICNGEELDRIYLQNVIRKELKTTKPPKGAGDSPTLNSSGELIDIQLTSHIISIPYSQIKNINLRFIEVDDDDNVLDTLDEDVELFLKDLEKKKQEPPSTL